MIRKYKQLFVAGIILFLLLSALPIDTRGMEPDSNVWSITFKGEGEEPFFQSSVVMEVDLKGSSTKNDVMIFINKQKWEGDWDYDQNLKMIFRDQGHYEIHLIHKNGYEETRKITVEFDDPSSGKIDTGSYFPGTWSKHDILLQVYGARSFSGISHYEYKIGSDRWNVMQNNRLIITDNFDDQILVRPVSKAGRQGEIKKIWCRLWKKAPKIPKIKSSQRLRGIWYSKIPVFSYEIEQTEGPQSHVYSRLVQLETKQSQFKTDGIPKIKKDGKYQLEIWTKDEAGNKSQSVYRTICFVDTKKPEIFVQYENSGNDQEMLKYQKAVIKVKDENLLKNAVKIKTSGKQKQWWKQEKGYYQTEVIFEQDGQQNLWIQAQDMAGNISEKEEAVFQIDRQRPEIKINGVKAGQSYKKPVRLNIQIKDENPDPDKTKIYLNGKKWKDHVICEDGYYTAEVEAEDLAGNKNRVTRRFTVNQKGIDIHFLQPYLNQKSVGDKNLKPGFRITSLEPVQVTEFLVNGQKVSYQWDKDKVYLKEPITDNGQCTISLNVKDANGVRCSSEKVTFFYDTKKPVIKIKGLDQNKECEYGKEIMISLENEKDAWTKVKLDGKDIKGMKGIIQLKKLYPGDHILDLGARDSAGNKINKKIKFTVTKILPDPIRKIVRKEKKEKGKEEKKEKTSKSYLWIIVWTIIGVPSGIIIYRKCLKI